MGSLTYFIKKSKKGVVSNYYITVYILYGHIRKFNEWVIGDDDDDDGYDGDVDSVPIMKEKGRQVSTEKRVKPGRKTLGRGR